MKQVVTSLEMKNLDLLASKKYTIPLVLLMENAGAEVSRTIVQYAKTNNLQKPNILIFAGPGNNGGDGIVMARHLLNSLNQISILLLIIKTKPYQGDAKLNYEILKKIWMNDHRVRIIEISEPRKFRMAMNFKPDIVVDAIFGTGFKGSPRSIYKNAIDLINKNNGYKVAVDMPSGVNGDTGQVEGVVVKANITITMGLLKRGHILYPGKNYSKEIKIANLGVRYDSLMESNTFLLDESLIQVNLPKRKPNGHKGTFGSVVVVAGGKGFSGAACLTSLGVLTSGAGIVRLCFPTSINAAVEKRLVEVIKVPLVSTKEGTLSLNSYTTISKIVNKSTVMAIGPGLTTNQETKQLIRKIISNIRIPTVIDADGLNNISIKELFAIPKLKRLNIVLTPHPGEFERLFGVTAQEANINRIEVCREWAKKLSLTVVLKGAPTVIGTPSGNVYINPTGNSGLAKGGSGDVLTGIITGFIAQGVKPWIAACIGVYLHGYAADLAVKDKTEYSLIATDLIKTLPKAIKSILNIKYQNDKAKI